jgi:hypothetical protein
MGHIRVDAEAPRSAGGPHGSWYPEYGVHGETRGPVVRHFCGAHDLTGIVDRGRGRVQAGGAALKTRERGEERKSARLGPNEGMDTCRREVAGGANTGDCVSVVQPER